MRAVKKMTKGGVVLPVVDRTLQALGHDINVARRARNIAMADMAQRMGCSRSTLHRLENGDAGVSLNTLARALQVLGLLHRLTEVIDQSRDDIGLMMHRRALPERVSRPRKQRMPHAPDQAEVDPQFNPEGW